MGLSVWEFPQAQTDIYKYKLSKQSRFNVIYYS